VPLGEETPLERGHQRGVPPLRNRYFTTTGSSSVKKVADGQRVFNESSARMHQIWVPSSKRAVSATVVQSSKRTVADRQRLAAYHNKRC